MTDLRLETFPAVDILCSAAAIATAILPASRVGIVIVQSLLSVTRAAPPLGIASFAATIDAVVTIRTVNDLATRPTLASKIVPRIDAVRTFSGRARDTSATIQKQAPN